MYEVNDVYIDEMTPQLPHPLLGLLKGFGEEVHVLEGCNETLLSAGACRLERNLPSFVRQCMLQKNRTLLCKTPLLLLLCTVCTLSQLTVRKNNLRTRIRTLSSPMEERSPAPYARRCPSCLHNPNSTVKK